VFAPAIRHIAGAESRPVACLAIHKCQAIKMGHTFGDDLTKEQRWAVIGYLKTL